MSPLTYQTAGRSAGDAQCALLLLHGRGGTAEDILSLAPHLHLKDFHIVAPQAPGGTWYPYSFMAPQEQNEPFLSQSLAGLRGILDDLAAAGFSGKQLYFAGFSQGACLCLELAARSAGRFGGIAAFTGGLLGERIYGERYSGSFEGTPVYISTGDPDPHVPLGRVEESADRLREMKAQVTVDVYPGRPHTVTSAELLQAARLVFGQHPMAG